MVAVCITSWYTPLAMWKAPPVVDVRHKLGLSQRAFARLLDLGWQTVASWEQGIRSPLGPARALLRILDKEPEAALRALRDDAPVKRRSKP